MIDMNSNLGATEWVTTDGVGVEVWDDINVVSGGYITVFYPNGDSGEFNFEIREIGTLYQIEKTVKTVPITIHEWSVAADKWVEQVVSEHTSSNMDSFEKMDSVCEYLISAFTYLKNDGQHLLNLTTSANPYFISYEWDSFTSPAVLCEIAEKIGGFDSIHNCYYDYPIGSPQWQNTHYYCKVKIGETAIYYMACRLAASGYIKNIEYVDFTNTSSLTKLG